MRIKSGITAEGFRTAVRDYTEPTVVEELAANSYDADASVVVVLLDSEKGSLHIVDDGMGFSQDAFEGLAILGAGSKQGNIPYSKGKRHYLGSYGYGLKSTLNIANQIHIRSVSEQGQFETTVDWTKLDDSLKPDFPGFPSQVRRIKKGQATGTWIRLTLKNPTSKSHLDQIGALLSNLPTDGGSFRCYFGDYSEAAPRLVPLERNFGKLAKIARALYKSNRISLADTSLSADLSECETLVLTDKEDKKVTARFFFAGISEGKVRSLKTGLRGIYVRIHGRLLKQNFTNRSYTYNISKWVKFENGLRVELSIDWLRDQITLSREGIRFSNTKLEDDFKSLLSRLVSRFIQPYLKRLEKKKARVEARKHEQRMELASKRIGLERSILVPGVANGFRFIPETDGELVLLLAQDYVIKKLNKNYRLIDYNDQAPFDCLIFDNQRRALIATELEPTLPEFLEHRDTTDVQLVVTWSRGKWRVGASKKGRGAYFRLISEDGSARGWYRLLEFRTPRSKTPRKDFPVAALDELLK